MELMGDKITARQTVDDAGVPVIPGSKVQLIQLMK